MTAVVAPIVVGVDGSESALDAVRWAAAECARHRVPLRLVHGYVLPVGGYPEIVLTSYGVRESMAALARGWLEAGVAAARSTAPDVDVETDSVLDGVVPTLIRESKRARMVVLGSRGLGAFTGMLLGSTAVALAAHGKCPVVVVRGAATEGGPVVVGVDGTPASEAAIAFAFEAASTREAPLTAVLSWTDVRVDSAFTEARITIDWSQVEEEEERLLAQRLAGWQEKYPDVRVERLVLRDRPVHALLRLAETAQLLVVGSRGRGGFTGMLLGSTSQALVHHSHCPVAVVRPA
ncbi:universal stress protein [Umezawaea sp.]|uniref:universal stress protein n=1 Tax=Umezawaea sp. TaxID=1955258 RepID=UPI002ED5C286